jgi:thiamine biosynthesis lipoprotein
MPGGVDPTGLVKGWAVERALDVLRLEGVTGALVNGGGDLAAFGCPAAGRAWRIGIRHPWRHDALACVIRIQAAVATSGTYERGPHLLDPFTGRPGNRAVSATVTGPSLALADALATAVAAGGDDAMAAVAALDGYAGYLIRPDGSEADTGGIQFVS